MPVSIDDLRSTFGGASDEETLQAASANLNLPLTMLAQEVGYDTGGKWGNRLSASVDSYQANMYGLGEAITGSTWMHGQRQRNEAQADVSRQFAADQGAISSYKDVNSIGTGLDYLGGQVVNTLPYAAEAVVGGVLTGMSSLPATAARYGISRGATRAIGGAAVSYPSAVGDILQSQRDQSGETDGVSAAIGGVGYAALNAIGIEGGLARGQLFRSGIDMLDNVSGLKGLAARTGATALRTAPVESATETGQEVINQYFGRMAVDPNATLTDPDAIDRYKESAVAGAAVGSATSGALGGWRRSEGYLPPGQTADDPQADLLGGGQPPIRVVDNSVPLQQFLDAQFGIDGPRAPKDYAKQFEEAASEPSDTYVQDPETGVERRLDALEDMNLRAGTLSPQPTSADNPPAPTSKIFSPVEMELIEFGVVPTKKKVEMFEDAKASGLDLTGDDFQPFWAAMAENKLGNAKKMLAQAVIEFRKGQAAQAPGAVRVNPDAPVAPTQPAAVSPDVQDAPPVAAGQSVTQAAPAQAPASAGGVVAEPAGVPAAGAGAGEAAVVAEPVVAEPAVAEPAVAEPAVAEPAVAEPAVAEPAVAEPAVARPASSANQGLVSLFPRNEDGTITVGRKGREKKLTPEQLKDKLMDSPEDLKLISMVLGADGAAPRSYEDAARLIAEESGAAPKSRQRVQQILADYGLNATVVSAITAQNPDVVAETELTAEGMRVEDTAAKATGQGQVLTSEESGMTAAQKAQKKEADKLLGGTKKASRRDLYKPAQDATLEKRRAAAAAAAEKELSQLLSDPETSNAIADFNDTRFDGSPEFDQLTTGEKLEYLNEYNEQVKDTGSEWAPIEDLIRRLSKEFQGQADSRAPAADVAGSQPADNKPAVRNESSRNQVSPAETAWNELSARFPMMPDWSGLSERQQKQVTDLVSRDQFNLAAANTVAGGSTDVNRDVLESRGKSRTRGSTVADVTEQAKAFLRVDSLGRNVFVVDSLAALPDGVGQNSQLDGSTQGVAVFDGKGGRKVYLIANQIAPGKVKSVFMHEVGAHIGLEQLLSPAEFKALTDQILKWAKAYQEGSEALEHRLASAAVERVSDAEVAAADQRSEVLAYFIEEAVDAGIDPTAVSSANGPLRLWFRRLWAAFKTAIHKLGIKPESLTARDVVDMAYGAARLEVAGSWHGTAADFRNFNHAYMSTGEGAQAFGWGTYLAQRKGIGQGYLEADVDRKTEPQQVTIKLDGKEVISDLEGRNWIEYAAALEARGHRFDESERRVLSAFMSRLTSNYNGDVNVYEENKTNDRLYQNSAIGVQRLLNRFSSTVVPSKAPEGNLMRVDTAVSPEEMLSWDTSFAKQPDTVKKGLRAALKEAQVDWDALETGGRIYDNLAKSLKNDSKGTDGQEAASKLLEKHGIHGIRFKDAHSRDVRPTLTFDGESFSQEDFIDKTAKVRRLGENALTLRQVLRSGIDTVRSNLEARVKETEEMFFQINKDSSQRYGVPFNEAEARAKAKADTQRDLFQAKQLNWLNENASKIQIAEVGVTYNLVIFNDKNIQRVASLVGGEKTRVKFSKATPKSGVPAIDKLPATVGNFFQGLKDGASWVGLRTMFTKDLVNLAKQRMPSAAKYLAEMERIWVERGKMEREIDSVLEDFRKLPSNLQGTGPGSVNALIKDSTMERKWAFKPAWVPNAKVDPDMEARFKAMPAEARRVIMRVFEHGHNSLTQMKAAALANINSEYDDAIMVAKLADDAKDVAKLAAKKAKALGDYRSLTEMNSGWPYAPLKRFGKYVVMGVSEAYDTARRNADTAEMRRLESDPAHYFVAFAETKAEARRQQAEIAGRFAKSDHFEKLDQADSWMGGRDVMGAFSRLRTQVRNQAENSANDKTSKAMEDLLRQMYLTMLSENSVRKSEINRRNIAGADNDMMRAFATQGKAQAHFISGLKSNGKANDHLQGMQNEARDTFGSGRDKAQAISNEIARRHAMALEYAPPGGVEKAMAGTSVWMLLTNPSYFLVNATQPWMMTHPMLAAKHGYGRSAAALSKAYKDILPMVKNLSIDQEDYSKLPADVRAAVEELADRGVIDISLESHLGNFRSVKDSAVGNAFEKSMTWMRNSAQFVEAMNRLSSAVAAYRLERAAGKDHAAGVAYAGKVIYETHGDYSGFNSPRFMRKGFWKLATQFRKFQLIQLSMFARYMQEALKGATPEERLVAQKAIVYNFTHLFAAGGLMGLPGFTAIAWIVGTLFGDDDEPKDPEATLRRIIGDKELADLLLKGAPKLAGVDVSGRIGAGGMLSILPYADISFSRDGYSEMALGLMGPFLGGLAPKAMDGVDLISQGKYWEGTEKLMPTLLANAMTATRYSMDGVTRRNGDVVLSPDELTFLDGVAKTLGLPTNTLTDRQFLSNAQFKTDEFYRNRTSQLKRAYTEAVRSGDEAARREALQDWKDTQEARRRVGMKTQPLSELLKAPREQAKRERNTVAGVQVRENNRGVIEKLTATQ